MFFSTKWGHDQITAQNGKIRADEYENRIEEALRQAGIDVEEENKE